MTGKKHTPGTGRHSAASTGSNARAGITARSHKGAAGPAPVSTAGAGIAERLARREQLIVLLAAGIIVVLAATYTVFGAGLQMSAVDMTRLALAPPSATLPATAVPSPAPQAPTPPAAIPPTATQPAGTPQATMPMVAAVDWTPAYATLVALMWWVMMIAMMTPSAAPALLLFTALKRHSATPGKAPAFALLFLAGYLLIWALFSLVATLLQWGLGHAGLVAPLLMKISSAGLAGTVLILAGLYQFSNLKNACLDHCRSPAQFLTRHRRPGARGALQMGAHHGMFCLGCCWALMALLFVGGIMNLFWIAGLALYVIAEKTLPNTAHVPKLTGAALVLAGLAVLFA
jgi:predicted metal-binding membrane protein